MTRSKKELDGICGGQGACIGVAWACELVPTPNPKEPWLPMAAASAAARGNLQPHRSWDPATPPADDNCGAGRNVRGDIIQAYIDYGFPENLAPSAAQTVLLVMDLMANWTLPFLVQQTFGNVNFMSQHETFVKGIIATLCLWLGKGGHYDQAITVTHQLTSQAEPKRQPIFASRLRR